VPDKQPVREENTTVFMLAQADSWHTKTPILWFAEDQFLAEGV